MGRDLQRRLNAAETRRFGSARVAEVMRGLDSMSDLELAEHLSLEPSGVLDPRTMTDSELDCCMAELERRVSIASPVRCPNRS
jgi:hypothetical protein